METKEKNTEFSGKAIYRPKGKAGEYARWAANLYVGCSNGCSYCYCKKGVMNHAIGQDEPQLKKCFKDEHDAIWTFRKELMRNRDAIIREGGIFFSFTTDPCLMKTWRTHFDCIVFALAAGVPVTILTKCVGWLEEPYTRYLWDNPQFKDRLCVGFTLTGADELEPKAASNDERIEAMEKLHDMGVKTFASIEPIIRTQDAIDIIARTARFCDLYKIGVLTGQKKDYNYLDIQCFIGSLFAQHCLLKYPPQKVYLKESLVEMSGMTIEELHKLAEGNSSLDMLVNANYNIFNQI